MNPVKKIRNLNYFASQGNQTDGVRLNVKLNDYHYFEKVFMPRAKRSPRSMFGAYTCKTRILSYYFILVSIVI